MADHSKLQIEVPHFEVADWRAYACLDNSRDFHQFDQIAHVIRKVAFLRDAGVTTAKH